MSQPRYPALYQINTRVWLTALGRALGRLATLDDVPDAALDRVAAHGFDWVWLLGVWRTGEASRAVSRSRPDWLEDYRRVLPDLTEPDIQGSCFAVTGYEVHPALGGNEALLRLRGRLAERGLRLMLDFVPNHVALDHPWIAAHPDWFIAGSEEDLAREPANWARIAAPGPGIFAYGRDPYFPGWADTLQLNYGSPGLQAAMRGELLAIARLADGVRCDMAMLELPDVFHRTWGIDIEPFWPGAIETVRARHPGFRFMAEVYWDLEWTLQQQGFDYAYDKRLYDRLREPSARHVRDHLIAGLDYQDRLARFLENHDEPRATATFAHGQHEAAAVITFVSPGLRFFQDGQFEGRRAHVPTHLVRAPDEPRDEAIGAFYERLLAVLRSPIVRDGAWMRLEAQAAWDGNQTWDGFVAALWRGAEGAWLLAVANYAPFDGQCYLRIPMAGLAGRTIRLKDLMSPAVYDREGGHLIMPGLYLDLPAWGYHVFEAEAVGA